MRAVVLEAFGPPDVLVPTEVPAPTVGTGQVLIAVEPAIYATELRAGIRLENNYLVTERGVELLSDFPFDL